MPQDVKTYKVFISSPNDVAEERHVTAAAVRAVSRTYEARGVRVEPWQWEQDLSSEFGGSAQSIIFDQLGDYDIYIGLMGVRFGSPTERFGSGTEEEFEHALKAHEAGTLLRVGFLFKNVQISFSDVSDDDIDQMKKVIQFKRQIGPRGVYEEFHDNEQLGLKVQALVADAIERDLQQVIGFHQYTLLTGDGNHGKPMISKGFFDDVLNQLDEDLTNGMRGRLTLDDVWVEPELLRLSSFAEGIATSRRPYNMAALCSDVREGKSSVVFGTETCGRSSLCCKLFVALYADGYLPVLLKGPQINNPDPKRFLQRLWLAYAVQYENLSAHSARRISRDKIVVIIDDFDRSKMAQRRLLPLLALIPGLCHAMIVTASSLFAIGVLDLERDAVSSSDIQRIEIKDIGHRNRYELIERWCLAGQDDALDDEKLRSHIEGKRRIIDRVLGANLVPRTPVIVLILLQAIDAGQVGDLARAGYVRYYKFLIDAAILRSASREDVEIAYALLPEIAWAIYRAEANSLRLGEVEHVIEEFASRRALRLARLYSALTCLQRMGMFEEGEAGLQFKHQYVFYFFLGDYISSHLDAVPMGKEVMTLCNDITENQNSNILVFLSFFSNSATVIGHLKENLSRSFASTEQFEFHNQSTELVNRLVDRLPKEVIDHTQFAENRKKRLEAEDARQEQERKKEQRKPDKTMQEFHVAFTSIEVLGHILRNHYAKLDAEPKVEIFDAAVSAGLRWLGSILESLSTSMDILITLFRTFAENSDTDEDERKREEYAKRTVFYIVVYLSFFTIRRIVRAVGDEDLDITYRHATKVLPPIAGDFIKLAIKLDCFRQFPMDDLRSVTQSLKNDRLGAAVLRLILRQRLDMRPPGNLRDLRRICQIAGLDLKPLLVPHRR